MNITIVLNVMKVASSVIRKTVSSAKMINCLLKVKHAVEIARKVISKNFTNVLNAKTMRDVWIASTMIIALFAGAPSHFLKGIVLRNAIVNTSEIYLENVRNV
jgi:hypothetical protein